MGTWEKKEVSGQVPITLEGMWDGSAIQPVTGPETGTNNPPDPEDPPPTGSRFAGHQPGKCYIGMGVNGGASRWVIERDFHENLYGAGLGHVAGERSYYVSSGSNFNAELNAEGAAYNDMADQGKLAIMSVKNPNVSGGEASYASWNAIANGQFDAQLQARGDYYKSLYNSRGFPVWSGFFHEPIDSGAVNTAPGSTTEEKWQNIAVAYTNAWVRYYDIIKSRFATLDEFRRKVMIFCAFNEWNFRDNNAYPQYLMRAPFLDRLMEGGVFGFDLYQTRQLGLNLSQRLGTIRTLVRAASSSGAYNNMMYGIFELGCGWEEMTNVDGGKGTSGNDPWDSNTPGGSPPQILQTALEFCLNSTNNLVYINYFNSVVNSRCFWALRARTPSVPDGDPFEYGATVACNAQPGVTGNGGVTTMKKSEVYATAIKDPRCADPRDAQ